MEFTNDFKAIGPADDPMVIKGQQELLRDAVSRVMFCPFTGVSLDCKKAVLLIISSGRHIVMAADHWDSSQSEILDIVSKGSGEIEVYDGRELWS